MVSEHSSITKEDSSSCRYNRSHGLPFFPPRSPRLSQAKWWAYLSLALVSETLDHEGECLESGYNGAERERICGPSQ